MTYRSCKLIIGKKAFRSKAEIQGKLDVFLAFDRLTIQEYEELSTMLNAL